MKLHLVDRAMFALLLVSCICSIDALAETKPVKPTDELLRAIQLGDENSLVTFVAKGGDVQAANHYGITPLAAASQTGQAALVRRILDLGADPNDRKHLPGTDSVLMLAARSGSLDCVDALLEAGAEVDATGSQHQTALMWAAAEGHDPIVRRLLAAGADATRTVASGFSALTLAARQGHADVVSDLLDHGVEVDVEMKPKRGGERAPREGMTALMIAIESGHDDLAMMLVDRGADPNNQSSGYAPLHAISWVRKANRGDDASGDAEPRGSGTRTSLDFVRDIVAAGADVNLALRRGPAGRAKLNHRGATPCLLAGKTADLPLLQLLVELGADSNIPNIDGCTPLMAAAGIGVIAVGEEAGTETEVLATIDFLISHGADPNRVDKNDETAMHGAAYRNYPKVVHRLAELGADPKQWDHKNKWGWTPVRIAEGYRPGSFKPSPPTIAALIAAGASPPTQGFQRESEYAAPKGQ